MTRKQPQEDMGVMHLSRKKKKKKKQGPKDRNKATTSTSIEGSTWLAHQVKARKKVARELVMPRY